MRKCIFQSCLISLFLSLIFITGCAYQRHMATEKTRQSALTQELAIEEQNKNHLRNEKQLLQKEIGSLKEQVKKMEDSVHKLNKEIHQLSKKSADMQLIGQKNKELEELKREIAIKEKVILEKETRVEEIVRYQI